MLAVQVLFLVALALSMAFGARETSHQQLTNDLASGKVGTVVVATHHWPDPSEMENASGCAAADLTWRSRGLKRSTSIITPLGSTPAAECDGQNADSQVVKGNITEHLRALAPDVRGGAHRAVVQHLQLLRLTIPAEKVPPPLVVVAVTAGLLAMLAPLFLVMVGPAPRHATRWAWVWLMCSPWSLWLTLAYLFIATRGAQPGRRQLTGGWAFLLSMLLNAAGN